ncbi:type IV toxin-antitoxin system AbiEi family antitoxin domain-containing protein [Kribbella sp. HUAS MG21]|uniref:Type IV toxin-antitoxin system AbiEi family antitoxin domain-containing protein n=1 Tax=Kribbella sp. HUAS MG21 TaxID=3160966 RepID=A0AAU7TJC8_9ACTN
MNRRLEVIAARRGGWFTRQDTRAAGYSEGEFRQRVDSGRWVRLSFNSYVEPRGWPADEPPWDRAIRLHTLAVRMANERLGDVVVSHQSATMLHGLPVWGTDLSKVHFTRVASGRARSSRTVQVHRRTTAVDEVVELGGLKVSTVERAIVETACTTSYEVGVVLVDAALRMQLTTKDDLAAVVRRHCRWHGSPAARAAVQFADGLSESVGESRLRVLMANHGLPTPELQVEITDDAGRLIGRVDFLLAGALVVEFDGALKYGDTGEAVLAEKWREDRLRERGYGVLRVGWSDLDRPRETAARIWRALSRHAPGSGNTSWRVPRPREVS